MTEIYLSDITRYDGRIDKLKEGMPAFVLKHCSKHKCREDLQASLLGWNILLMLLNHRNVDTKSLSLSYNKYGKPFLGNHYFSISHSGEIVAVCLSTSEVGIDIEKIRPDRDYDFLAERFFSEEEKKQYHASSKKEKCFIQLWTRKEAFHKHVGDGIQLDNFKKDIPYKEILTTYLEDKNKDGYYLSVDCIDNEKVHFRVI